MIWYHVDEIIAAVAGVITCVDIDGNVVRTDVNNPQIMNATNQLLLQLQVNRQKFVDQTIKQNNERTSITTFTNQSNS